MMAGGCTLLNATCLTVMTMVGTAVMSASSNGTTSVASMMRSRPSIVVVIATYGTGTGTAFLLLSLLAKRDGLGSFLTGLGFRV